jgi:RNA polymerase sigma-70 factor, ECF subfamily
VIRHKEEYKFIFCQSGFAPYLLPFIFLLSPLSSLHVTFPALDCFIGIETFMARDDEDFTMIFQANYPGLCRFLECLMGGREGSAQDIAQESLMRLYKLGPENLPVAEARFWLFRVARNLALNEISRRETRSKFMSRVRHLFRSHESHPAESLERQEQMRILLQLLKTLPEHQRAALLLREQEEMSYRQIARVLNVSESKVKVDIFRARSKLRASLKESDGDASLTTHYIGVKR